MIPRRRLAPAIESFPVIVRIDGTHMRGAIIGSAIPSEENPFLADNMKSTAEERWAAFGHTDDGRLLTVVFTKRGNLIRIIPARDMNRKERRFYEENG
jgi:uncharacterized DUF497 family protein